MNRVLSWIALAISIFPTILVAQNLVVTTNDTITVATYDNVTVQNGGTLVVNGVLNVRQNMIIESGGMVTHKERFLNGLTLNILGQLEIKAGGNLSGDEKGLLGGWRGAFGVHGETFDAAGNIVSANNGAKSIFGVPDDHGAGGSYGGAGGVGIGNTFRLDQSNPSNPIYGIAEFPNLLGSGGGGSKERYVTGGTGGGLLIVNCASLLNYGAISCTGTSGSRGGGSGGSIRITADTLSGNGSIKAEGGYTTLFDYAIGGGGGGRIALFFKQMNLLIENISAMGGSSGRAATPSFFRLWQSGSAGTIYLKNQNESKGNLIIDNKNLAATAKTDIKSQLAVFKNVIVAAGTFTSLSQSIQFDTLKLLNGSALNIANHATVSFAKFDTTNIIAQNSTFAIDTGSILSLSNHQITIPTGLTFVKDGQFGINEDIYVVKVQNGANLTHRSRSLQGLYLKVRDSVVIDAGGAINTDEQGLLGFTQLSQIVNGANPRAETLDADGNIVPSMCISCATGGSYASQGGSRVETGRVYGLLESPQSLGSGGGGVPGSSPNGGNGGGKVIIETNRITLRGHISANGGNGNGCCGFAHSGGGSGGSIWLKCKDINGTGTISASGGAGSTEIQSGAGSGGRIALEFETTTLLEPNIKATSGAHPLSLPETFGGAGTIYLKNKLTNHSKVIVDNGAYTSPNQTPSPTNLTTISAYHVGRNGHVLLPLVVSGRLNTVLTFDPSASGSLQIPTGLTLEVPNSTFVVNGKVIKDGFIGIGDSLKSLVINNNGILTHSIRLLKGLNLNAKTVDIKLGGSIDLTGVGLRGGNNGSNFGFAGEAYHPDGKTIIEGSNASSGASHGGLGEISSGNTPPNRIYGDAFYPALLGSGGGGATTSAGEAASHGGGLLYISAKSLIINGKIIANGGVAPQHVGGGSGGSVLIFADTLAGNGTIEAKGGNGGCTGCAGASGGGGRIAIYTHVPNLPINNLSVAGGLPNFGTPQKGTIIYQNCGFENNVGIDTLLYPSLSVAKFDSTITPIVVIKNYSPVRQAFPTQINIGNRYSDAISVVLQSGQSDTIRFAPYRVAETGTLNVRVQTDLVGDNCAANNLKTTVLTVAQLGIPAITTVAPNKGGNTGSTTVKITGIQFREGIQVWLEQNGQQLTAHYVQFVDSNHVFASFNLMGVSLGMYKVFVQNLDIQRGVLNDAFEVVQGAIGWGGSIAANCSAGKFNPGQLLRIETSYPQFARINSIYPITIHFTNTSNIDFPIPTVVFESTSGNPVSFTTADLMRLPCTNCPSQTRLFLSLTEANAPPNILRAGASGEIKVYVKALVQGPDAGNFRIID